MCQIIQLYACQHWVKSGTCTAQSSTSTPCLGYNSVTLVEKDCPECDGKKHPDQPAAGEQMPTGGPPKEPTPNTNHLGEPYRNVKLADQTIGPRPVESGSKTRPAEAPERKQEDDTIASSERPSPPPETLKHRPTTGGAVAGPNQGNRKPDDRNDSEYYASTTNSGASTTSTREGKWPKMMSIISRKHGGSGDVGRPADLPNSRGNKLQKHLLSSSVRPVEDERKGRLVVVNPDSRSVSESPPRLPELGLSPLFTESDNPADVGDSFHDPTHYLGHQADSIAPATSFGVSAYQYEPTSAPLNGRDNKFSFPADSNIFAEPPKHPPSLAVEPPADSRTLSTSPDGPREIRSPPADPPAPPNVVIPSKGILLNPTLNHKALADPFAVVESPVLPQDSFVFPIKPKVPESSTVAPQELPISPVESNIPEDSVGTRESSLEARYDNLPGPEEPGAPAETNVPTAPATSMEPNVPASPIASTEPNIMEVPAASTEPNISATSNGSTEPNRCAAPTVSTEPKTSAAPAPYSEPNISPVLANSKELGIPVFPTAPSELSAPAVSDHPVEATALRDLAVSADTTASVEPTVSSDLPAPTEEPHVSAPDAFLAQPDDFSAIPDAANSPQDSLSALGLAVQRRWGTDGSNLSASAYSSTRASPRSLSPIPERLSHSPPISPIQAEPKDLFPIAEQPSDPVPLQSLDAISTTSSLEEDKSRPSDITMTEESVQQAAIAEQPSPTLQPNLQDASTTSLQSASTVIRRAKSPTNSLDAAAQRLDGVDNGANGSISYSNGRFSASTQSLDAAIRRTISIAISEAVDPSPQSPTEEISEQDRCTSVTFAEDIEEIPEVHWQPNHPLARPPQKPEPRDGRKSWFRRGLLRSRSANEETKPLPNQGWNVPLPPARRHEDFPTVPCNLPAKPPSIIRRTTEPLEPLHEVDEYHHNTSWMDRVPPDYVRRPNIPENDGRQSRAAMFGMPSIHSPKDTDYDDDLTPSEDESDDEAAPPPIRRARSAPGSSLDETALTIINGEAHPGRKLSFPSVNGSPVNGHSANGAVSSPAKRPPSRTPSSTSSIKAPSPLRHQLYPGSANQPTWFETGTDASASYLVTGAAEQQNHSRLSGPGVKVTSRVSIEDLATKEKQEPIDVQEVQEHVMQEDYQESIYSQEGIGEQQEQPEPEQDPEHSDELIIQKPEDDVVQHDEEQVEDLQQQESKDEHNSWHSESQAVQPPEQVEEANQERADMQIEQQRRLQAQQEKDDEITPAPPKYQNAIPFVSPLVSAPEIPQRSTLRKVPQRQPIPKKATETNDHTKGSNVQNEINRINTKTQMNGAHPVPTRKRTQRERPYDPSERPREPLSPSEDNRPWQPPQGQPEPQPVPMHRPEKKRRHTLFGRDEKSKDRSASPQSFPPPMHVPEQLLSMPERRPSVAEKRSSRGFGKHMTNKEKRDWIEVMAKDHEFGFL